MAASDNRQSMTDKHAIAVVVGLCAHGLEIARSLYRAGIPVIAIEDNMSLPGTRTRCISKLFKHNFHSDNLIIALKKLHAEERFDHFPILFLTNDEMVRTVAINVDEITNFYRLSWKNSAETIAELLNKDNLSSVCQKRNINYPKSIHINDYKEIEKLEEHLPTPIILKPVKPLSKFKTITLKNSAAAINYKNTIEESLPIIAQNFIPGGDEKILFAAIYFRNGNVISRFEGRKLNSRPMGHTTVAIPEVSDRAHSIALDFFDGMNLSGPVSLEMKEGPDGNLWVIEPTVGRTDFWLGLCTANGVNFPLIEYKDQSLLLNNAGHQCFYYIWINSERQPWAKLWLLKNYPELLYKLKLRDIYYDKNDIKPFISSKKKYAFSILPRAIKKIKKSFKFRQSNTILPHLHGITVSSDVDHLANASGDFESTPQWFKLLQKTVFPTDTCRFIINQQENNDAIALPIAELKKNGECWINSLSTYYTSLYSPIKANQSPMSLITPCVRSLLETTKRIDAIRFSPMDPESEFFEVLENAIAETGWKPFKFFCFGNWYLPVETDWKTYFNQREGLLRSTVKRKTKAFHAKGGRLEIISDATRIEAGTQAYLSIYAKSWKKPEPHPDFIPSLINILAASKKLRLGIAWINDIPAAAQIWFIDGDKARIFKLAYDEDFSRDGVGTILTAHLMEQVIDRDQVKEVDYLIGDDPYKRQWMTHRRERWGIVAYNPKTLRGKLLFAREIAGRAFRALMRSRREWIKQTV